MAPTVVLIAPGDGSTFAAGSSITLAAQASDSDGQLELQRLQADRQQAPVEAGAPVLHLHGS
ncbi:MAG: Ig-like domain-containing protein [Pseudomonadota bacterium]|nr:Ig-like domain-containing protein [Pseudomonadota bacterium]